MIKIKYVGLLIVISALGLSYFFQKKSSLEDTKKAFKDNKKQNFLNIAITQEWSNFNPVLTNLASTESLINFVNRKMSYRKMNGEIIPMLATGIPQLKSDKTAIWNIKADAFWGDGVPVTCLDWHLAWQIGLNPNVSVENKEIYEKIKNIEWERNSPKECKVTYFKMDWSFGRDLPGLVPFHLEKNIFEKHKNEPEAYERNSNYIVNPTMPGLYNGPYSVSEFKVGSYLLFQKNLNQFSPAPKIDKVIVKLISDSNALKVQLLSGDINAINPVGFTPDLALLMSHEFEQNNIKTKVHFNDSILYQGLFLNLENTFLKDLNIRKALSFAIDKKKISTVFFENLLPMADSVVSPVHPAFVKKESQYSVTKAREVLEQAGWLLADDGYRYKNSKKLSFVFKTSAGLKMLESIQQVICENLKTVGVECNIKNEPPRVLLGQSLMKGDYDLMMFGGGIEIDKPLTNSYSSKNIPSKDNQFSGANVSRISSMTIDQFVKEFDSEMNFNKRNQIVKKIENEIYENYFVIPLYYRKESFVMPSDLNFASDSIDGTEYVMPETWYFK